MDGEFFGRHNAIIFDFEHDFDIKFITAFRAKESGIKAFIFHFPRFLPDGSCTAEVTVCRHNAFIDKRIVKAVSICAVIVKSGIEFVAVGFLDMGFESPFGIEFLKAFGRNDAVADGTVMGDIADIKPEQFRHRHKTDLRIIAKSRHFLTVYLQINVFFQERQTVIFVIVKAVFLESNDIACTPCHDNAVFGKFLEFAESILKRIAFF